MVDGHTRRYGIDRLVYFEIHETAYRAIQREKNIKHWPRVYKTRLIAKENVTQSAIYMMKLQGTSPIVGIAGTSPAMTR